MGASDPGQVRRSFGQVNGRTLFVGKKMTDKDTVATVASEAVRAIRGMNALLKDYSGTALAHLYELQETETIRLIVGAQPLIPPMPDGLLKFKTSGIKEYKKFFFASVLAAWWFTRTVAVFDKEMVEELLTTEQVDLQISVSQFARFLGNPVLIPFEKPYESGEFEILGCMIGFFEWGMDYQFPSGKKVKQSQIMFLPLLRKKATGEVNFSIGAPTLQRESSLDPTYNLSKIFEVLKTRSNFTGFGLYQHELFSKLAYLMTKTPDVNRCMSVSVPEVVRRRRKPSTIFAPEKPRMMELGEHFGNAVRQYKEAVASSSSAFRGTVRPHIRRAHWHTFLIGKGREGAEVKWFPPIFVKSADLSGN